MTCSCLHSRCGLHGKHIQQRDGAALSVQRAALCGGWVWWLNCV